MKTKNTKYGAAGAACCIRKDLKEKFPSIKFSVRSESFAGGDAVRVGWNLGPTTKEVEAVIYKYRDGHFNGMEDIYEYREDRPEYPTAKYVSTDREYMSAEEIENYKLDWKDPARRNMPALGLTLMHKIGADICALLGLDNAVYGVGANAVLPDNAISVRRWGYSVTLATAIREILYETPLPTGYHGVRLGKIDGIVCSNLVEIY